MKIITLNTWGGRAGKDSLINFFNEHKDSVDIFCLQEIWSAPYDDYNGHSAGGLAIDQSRIMTSGMQDISNTLSEHTAYFRPHFLNNYGLLMMVSKKLNVIAEGELFVYLEKGHIPNGDIGNHARNIQYVTVMIDQEPLTIINFHGLWNGKGKTDCDDRINQSKNIVKFTNSLKGEYVLCGDFNLLPDTESVKILESTGMLNLVKKYDIQSTRSSFYNKKDKFADYIFLSKNLKEVDFKVLNHEVSDHLPLFLEIM
ncbi:MAG: endonuclease/exonuclease/phosphatase family protein [Candidatus Paceibacterota bacterium]|jgi:endonuclease/exonuclease/phosphatase family metal-dependent hydrolase